jgi:Fur family ferric uptake transcriptional regulator
MREAAGVGAPASNGDVSGVGVPGGTGSVPGGVPGGGEPGGGGPATAPGRDEVIGVIGRPTRQRTAVVRSLAEAGDFTSAQALHARLRSAGLRVGLNTVYRTLTALAGAGRVDVVHEPSGERLFRYRPSPGHHHYLVCRDCGLSLPLDTAPVESWAEQVAAGTGFAEVTHTLELSGVCADCRTG